MARHVLAEKQRVAELRLRMRSEETKYALARGKYQRLPPFGAGLFARGRNLIFETLLDGDKVLALDDLR